MRHYISTNEKMPQVERWISQQSFVVFDIETGPREEYVEEWNKNSKVGLDPYKAQIVTYQIGNKDTQWIIDARTDIDTKIIVDLLENKDILKLGVNIKFDVKMVMHHLKALPVSLGDCMIMEQIIRCGLFPGRADDTNTSAARVALKYTSMAALAKYYLDLTLDKDKDLRITLWKTPPNKFDERQLAYMAGDCIYPHLIAVQQKPLINERGLDHIVTLEHKMIPVIADMELTGIPFNREYWTVLMQENVAIRDNAAKVLNKYLNKTSFVQEDFFGEGTKVNTLKLDSPQRLAKALSKAGFRGFVDKSGAAISTGSAKLKLMKIAGEMPADLVDAILEYRKVEKRITSYGQNFLKSVNSVTKRIHPDFTQTILVTGRMSCSPGMQTIPKESEYRQAFYAPDGYTLIILDASQIEARISADATGDKPAIDVFQRGGDIYKEDGEAFYNTTIDKNTPEGQKLRNRAKVSWLGLSYGQGKNRFHEYSKIFLGEDLSKSDTNYLYEKFFEIHWRMKEVMDEWSALVDPIKSNRYFIDQLGHTFIKTNIAPDLERMLIDRNWGDKKKAAAQVKKLLNNKEQVRFAESALGRKRFFRADFLGWWTAGRNMPVQGTAADLQKCTMLAFQNLHWKEGFDAHLINVVHDEIITLVREDQDQQYLCHIWGTRM